MNAPPTSVDLVVAVGPSALDALCQAGQEWSEGPRQPRLVALNCQYPPRVQPAGWRDRVFDLGAVGDPELAFDWCRRAQPPGIKADWRRPVEDGWLDPHQCQYLYHFHSQHGLIDAFWHLALPREPRAVHVVASLADGAGSLVPEVVGSLAHYLSKPEVLHLHLVLPEVTLLGTVRWQVVCACAGYSLRRIKRMALLSTKVGELRWLLQPTYSSTEELLSETATLVNRLVTCGPDSEPLLQHLCQLRDSGTWQEESPVLWGSYRVYAKSEQPQGDASFFGDEWIERGLPAWRVDYLRYVGIDWGLGATWREAFARKYPEAGILTVSDGCPRRAAAGAAQTCFGFLPEEFPSWGGFVSAAEQQFSVI